MEVQSQVNLCRIFYLKKKKTVSEEMLIPVFQFYIANNYSKNDSYLSLTVSEVHSTECKASSYKFVSVILTINSPE